LDLEEEASSDKKGKKNKKFKAGGGHKSKNKFAKAF
jgi:hypothetical protein